MRDTRLAGRRAIVTGGGSGIGLAIAQLFAQEGAAVVIAGRSRERGEAVVAEIVEGGGKALFVPTDVTSSADVQALMKAAVEAYGGIDVLVNNSGIEVSEGPDGPLEEAGWDELFDTNVKGVYLCCKHALPHLLRSGGVIVNMASMAGLVGVAGSLGYSASKAAVVSMTRSLALFYADKGIRVNAICPGPIMTQMTTGEWKDLGEEVGRQRTYAVCPARRIGETKEVAGLALYLASDEAAFITGAAVPIDGGKTAGIMPRDRYRW